MAGPMEPRFSFRGLTEAGHALRDAGPRLERDLRDGDKEIAKTITEGAKARAGSLPGKASKSIPGSLVADGNRIVLDGSRFPTALGDEFGAKGHPQFQAWRGNTYTDALDQGVGYALHPELRARSKYVLDHYLKVVDDLLEHVARA